MTLKIGHRGAAGLEPENTLRSFMRALKLGVDAVELDVHTCRTGELVVIHDFKVNRTTNGKGFVAKKRIDEIKLLKIKVGRIKAGRTKKEKIPQLSEVFDAVNKKAIINIELKGMNTASPVARLIKQYLEKGWKPCHFLVSSFDHAQLNRFKRIMPKIRTGALVDDKNTKHVLKSYPAFFKYMRSLNVYSINPPFEFISAQLVKDAHKAGFKVIVWTVNKKSDIKRMRSFGVDGIISDYPQRLRC